MLRRLLNRLAMSAVTLLGVVVVAFLLANAMPGDVARSMAGSKATPELLQEIRVRHHLDQPLWRRLGHHLSGLVRGDLGHSYMTEQPVADAILARLPTTAALVGVAVAMWMAAAVPLGVYTARHRRSWFDRGTLVFATVTLSLPAFWLAKSMQYWLAYRLGWFPVAGGGDLPHLLLPGATLALLMVGYYARVIHTHMVEVLDSPYIRAARSAGLSEVSVLFRHGLPNALIPVVTLLGMDIASLLGGAMFTENVFALPGIGTLAVEAVYTLDVPMVMGTVVFGAAMVVGANLVVDTAYSWIDPRIKSSR